jgi:dihydroorotate dehydrogenase (fumarate)
MNLGTTYLGLRLPHPLIVGSGPLTDDLDSVRRLEDEGAAALVLRSLHEEEITSEQMSAYFAAEYQSESFAEALSYAPEPQAAFGPEEYLEHLQRVKRAVRIPVIASLHGATPGGWTSHARLLEQAGREIRIPVAAKLPPLFTAFAHFARQLDREGTDGFVLFTGFQPIDIDVIELEVVRRAPVSDSSELALRLRGIAALSGRVEASLAVTGGVYTALDVVKATMAGAHATQMVSALFRHGPRHLGVVRRGLEAWMRENEWDSLESMRGNMSYERIPDPAAYERAHYRRMLNRRAPD